MIEPSDSDIADSPDSVKDYIMCLEHETKMFDETIEWLTRTSTEEFQKLQAENERMQSFIRQHCVKWGGVAEMQPSLDVLKRCLTEGESK